MNRTNKCFRNLRLLLVFFLFTLGATAASANTKDVSAPKAMLSADETYSIAVRGLTQKMETDLVLTNIKVKFVKAERYAISKSQIGIRGAGSCQLGAEDNALPINFDVKIYVNNRNIAEVAYNFVEAAEDASQSDAPSENETFVAQQLMEKFKADFKTENIIIAIDYLNENQTGGAKAFTGEAEVRLGDMVWKKISFEILAGSENQTGAAVKYKIR
ncbi:MAG TPA: hypothetical protein VK400_19020 [Pyrinomonadaceae bacterium]|nr:hypothetical protein [Pyrinomonadaceae bacterium]